MSEAEVQAERDGHVLTITLNRPARRNALTLTALSLLADVWQQFDEDSDLRIALLCGAGGSFCAGMDLRAMADGDGVAAATERARNDPDFAQRALLKANRPTKPIIAAVEGHAIAGGLELLLGTDIRVASTDARFGLSELKWALYPGGGGVVRLSRQIPYAVAADVILTGRHIDAVEAQRVGLVGQLVAPGTTLETARTIADSVAANGPLAVAAVVRTLRTTMSMPEEEAFAFEEPYIERIVGSEDAREGPRAFAEGRPPVFQGR
jgi:enoyl-CoA hydratase